MGCYPTGGFYEPDSGPAAARLRRKFLSDPPVQLFIQPGPRFKIKNQGFTILCLSTVRASRGLRFGREFVLDLESSSSSTTKMPWNGSGRPRADLIAVCRQQFQGVRSYG